MGHKANRKRLRKAERTSPKKELIKDTTDHAIEELKKNGSLSGLLCDYIYKDMQFFTKDLRTDKESVIREKVLRKLIFQMYNMKPEIKKVHLEMRTRILEERYG